MAFAEKMAETKLAGLKAVEPKLQAFYDSLDAKQKKAFDTGGRIGGIFDWWRRGSIYLFYSWSISLIAFFRTVSSISLPFASSIHAV